MHILCALDHLLFYHSICLCLSICLSLTLYVCLSLCLSLIVSVCVSIYLSLTVLKVFAFSLTHTNSLQNLQCETKIGLYNLSFFNSPCQSRSQPVSLCLHL